MTLFEAKKRDAAKERRERVRTNALKSRFRALNQTGGGIEAARFTQGGSWPGIQTQQGDDILSREYAEDLAAVQSRSQDLDVNQPDLRGFHRTRTAKILGRGIIFRHEPHHEEIGLTADATREISERVDRIREIHSRRGGFDSQGLGRSEGKQMERAMLSAFVHGSCLIHRVWRRDARYALPLTIELIPAYRISTPYGRQGDPKLSYGIEYTDSLRTKVVGFHVRRASMTIGDSFIPNFEWDFIPIEDASLLSLTEVAGIDRALPLSVATVRLLRNRGEFVEASVAAVRAQAQHYAVTECAPESDPWNEAADDSTETNYLGQSAFMDLGGVKMLYTPNGEKVNWCAAHLPAPDLEHFNMMIDDRLMRGLCSGPAQFTRRVSSSFAGGRLEDQQDDPIVDQYREALESAWAKVNQWFLESIWLTGAIDLPGYSAKSAATWCQFRAQYYGRVHINPVDTMTAREKGYALRTITPQQACEEDGVDFLRNMRQWGQATQTCREIERAYGLKEGELDFLLSGRAITTTGGNIVAPPKPDVSDPDPNDPSKPEMDAARNRAAMFNRLEAVSAR